MAAMSQTPPSDAQPSSSTGPDPELQPLREQIDTIDRELVALLNRRARVVQDIGRVKQSGVTPIYAPDREQQVLARIRSHNQGPLPDVCLEAIWRELMSGSFALERPQRVGYLGPPGSFSHVAARSKFGASVEYDGLDNIAAVFEELARNHIDLGITPIENSTDGGITETLDCFLDTRVKICAEVLIAVHQNLLSNSEPDAITRIYSKPNGFSQCRRWLTGQLAQAEHVPTPSTSKAAELAAKEPGAAAIGSTLAGEIYGLKTVYASIEDNPNNVTRFLVLANQSPPRTGDDKTSLMFTTAHQSGALADVLDVFRQNGLNLTHIDKRPSQRANWEYCFFVDCLGHTEDDHVRQAIDAAGKVCLQLTTLGSFPRAREVL